MERNDVSSYFYFMWNMWCESECKNVFSQPESQCNWQHFWDKWVGICNQFGVWGASERFYAELSEHHRDILVAYATTKYNRNKRLW